MEYGVVVDVETTGLDPLKDTIIEIGLVEFLVGENKIPTVVSCYGGVEDPGCPLTPEIMQLTGLSSDVLAGQRIDWPRVRQILERASVVIAHNAAFDRSFLRARPELEGLTTHWACSVRHIDWQAKGFATRKLTYLAADHGFVNPFPHRALFDCATTFRLVSPHLMELVETSYEPEVRFFAVQAPFEKKDRLKERGYRWDQMARVWHRTVTSRQADVERNFLSSEIYSGAALHREEMIREFGAEVQ